MPTPFIKFPGGKGYLADTILSHFPKKFKTYFEPMVGGGAIFFELAHRSKIDRSKMKKAWIADINNNLINIYEQLRDHLPEVVRYLRALRKKHNQTQGGVKELYYAVRKRVNRTEDAIEKAAGLIYLSKTCFNGLFRFNQSGKFNAPVGDQKNPKICDETNLMKVSNALQKVQLSCCSYERLRTNITKGDLVYLDPPYWPIRETSFTSYSASKFTKDDHEKLAQYFAEWGARGAYLVLSNSDTPEVRKLYKKFNIISVEAPRRINSNGHGRGLVKEILVKNF
jgi:DNA adenine methylase